MARIGQTYRKKKPSGMSREAKNFIFILYKRPHEQFLKNGGHYFADGVITVKRSFESSGLALPLLFFCSPRAPSRDKTRFSTPE